MCAAVVTVAVVVAVVGSNDAGKTKDVLSHRLVVKPFRLLTFSYFRIIMILSVNRSSV